MEYIRGKTQGSPIRLCLFGATASPNLGVSALHLSVLREIFSRYPDTHLTVFDYGRGRRAGQQDLGSGTVQLELIGANMSRRYYRSDNLINMTVCGALGGLGNPGVEAMAKADAILDISGGDSFTDLYGRKRFRSMTLTKRLALRLGVPLYLLPQTYGPFESPRALRVAKHIVKGAEMAWARDARNFETLSDLLDGDIDTERHGNGVDVAFALPARPPSVVPERLKTILAADRANPVVGINVSGLIYNQGVSGSRRFGFKADYETLVHGVLERFMRETDAQILFVPHVLGHDCRSEADTPACHAAAKLLDRPDRVFVLDEAYDAMEMKWVIGQTDFFFGTRMHSTIAGLSSGVPTAAVAYSKKTLGVFESCGQGDEVVDPRNEDAGACVEAIWRSWQRRSELSETLEVGLPRVKAQAEAQIKTIFAHIDAQRKRRLVS